MIWTILFTVFFQTVNSDICNRHATLIEHEKFYLTQPFVKNVSINIAAYDEAFSSLSTLLPKFQNILHEYETEDSIKQTEKVELTPFDQKYNVYPITTDTLGHLAYNACSVNQGTLVPVNAKNRAAVAALLEKFQIEKTPVNILQSYSTLSHSGEILDTPSAENLKNAYKAPPMFTKANQFTYPIYQTTTGGVKTDTTVDDYKSKVLCAKENNVWDLPVNRENWLSYVPTIKRATNLLAKLTEKYENSAKTIEELPKNKIKQAAKFFKMILPEPFQKVIKFLDKFSIKRNWEKTDVTAIDDFITFVKTSSKIARMFKMNPHSIINMSTKKQPMFKPVEAQELNWKNLFGLDEEVYGVTGPVSVTLISSHIVEDNDKLVNLKATVRVRIFNRDADKITIYNVLSNIIYGKMTTVQQVIQTSKFALALTTTVHPSECHTISTEMYKVCHKFPYQTPSNEFVTNMIKCATALKKTDHSAEFDFCPTKSADSKPVMYRADCEEDGHSTLIINSVKPMNLKFLCDQAQVTTKEVTKFPFMMKTDCEVQISDSGLSHMGLPQFNPDFLQDPFIGTHKNMTTPPSIYDYLDYIIYSLSIGAPTLIITMILITCIVFRCKRRRRQTPTLLAPLNVVNNRRFPPIEIESSL